MDRTIEKVAQVINYATFNEGRLSKKDADVLVTRLVSYWALANVPFDQKAFYEACGLDKDKPVDGKEYN